MEKPNLKQYKAKKYADMLQAIKDLPAEQRTETRDPEEIVQAIMAIVAGTQMIAPVLIYENLKNSVTVTITKRYSEEVK